MAQTYKDLLKKREELEAQINQARQSEVSAALERIQALIQEFGLTQEEVFPPNRKPASSKGVKVAPKYKDPASGALWTGRGRSPTWFDKDRESEFLIEPRA